MRCRVGTFELLFACRAADGSTVPLIRTIAAPDLVWALRIGHAMAGEPVSDGYRLDCFVYAIPVQSPDHRAVDLSMGTPGPQSCAATWGRVLHILGLEAAAVKWVYSWRIGLPLNPRGHTVPLTPTTKPEIIGFFPWKP